MGKSFLKNIWFFSDCSIYPTDYEFYASRIHRIHIYTFYIWDTLYIFQQRRQAWTIKIYWVGLAVSCYTSIQAFIQLYNCRWYLFSLEPCIKCHLGLESLIRSSLIVKLLSYSYIQHKSRTVILSSIFFINSHNVA